MNYLPFSNSIFCSQIVFKKQSFPKIEFMDKNGGLEKCAQKVSFLHHIPIEFIYSQSKINFKNLNFSSL